MGENDTIRLGSRRDDVREPFPQSGLAALIAAAAADRPNDVLLADDDGSLTAGEVATRTAKIAGQFRSFGLTAGDRIVIVAGAQSSAVIALAAALAVGAEPALVPCGAGPVELAAYARAANAVAIIGPSSYGALHLGDSYLSTAALVDTIRIVATQGPEAVDGAVDLSAEALAAEALAASPTPHERVGGAETSVIATFEGPGSAPGLVLHRQAALFADALSLVENAHLNPSKSLLSTLSVATMAGLVAGPFAALVGAASLRLHGPFDGPRFLAACDAEPGAHLVAPAGMASVFAEKRLAANLASLILVSRFADQAGFTLPASLACDRPLVDLYAFGEDTLIPRRRTEGEAHPPARITDKRADGGLGAALNRANAETLQRVSSERK